ncbi:GNAT family N-acetyltransferase [Nocardia otitidiscaviarum]|uniref:GNAT family N-acetyltransferase n=1 Tax=Nocardia otitidiscaviarum TaxID=1823 RepID=UPI0004A6C69B|nr:GNAT family N-acetyltransferase [Nocardia otitidiscaviarum]MBF6241818.1 GNAT family N-acetyltransferase [Nocardia otitidiscaviarum]MBF6489161.1 GNAT family N-acetyltransferase [Nocardia otitidiscaviarum]
MRIIVDDLTDPRVIALLEAHVAEMLDNSPEDSMHALDLDGLRKPEITCWTVWDGADLAGCGALKELDATHGEIKSMRTIGARRGRGVGGMLLRHIVEQAAGRGYERLSLETGAADFYLPAVRLYQRHGFTHCGPFADYAADPHSVFMTRSLG